MENQLEGVNSTHVAAESQGKTEIMVDAAHTSSGSGANRVIDLEFGDPKLYEEYWRKAGEKSSITIRGEESLSYVANSENLCWFMEPKLEKEIKRLHCVVGNAKVEGHDVVVGNGSTQLIQAALYALCPLHQPNPTGVVSAAPFYSGYPGDTDLLRSTIFRWMGDAKKIEKDGAYVEIVTSPNNPDGAIRSPVVNQQGVQVVHDLAYYWPHYTPITSQLDEDLMLFTASKCTGHAGSRIGWALVRDREVAERMTQFIEASTIGVSKEAQLRTAKILSVVSESCEERELENFFLHGRNTMAGRWKRLRQTVESSALFTLPNYPLNYCRFSNKTVETYPAFAWMSCKFNHDLAQKLKSAHIIAKSGCKFGANPKYARISMLSNIEDFDMFLKRLAAMQPQNVSVN